MGVLDIFAKCVLHFFNFIIMLTGLVLIALGVLCQLGFYSGLTTYLPIYLIVAGTIVFIVSIIGCFGGIMENTVMLVVYSIFIAILIAGTVLIAVIAFRTSGIFLKRLDLNNFADFNRDVDRFSTIEKQYHCCGPQGAVSYQSKSLNVSNSCCEAAPCSSETSYPGCNDVMHTFFAKVYWIILGVAVGLALTQLLQLVASCYLMYSRRINVDKRQYV